MPHEGKLGFVILKRGAVELMLQSRASVAADIAGLGPNGVRAALYIEVDQLARSARRSTAGRSSSPGNVLAFASREA